MTTTDTAIADIGAVFSIGIDPSLTGTGICVLDGDLKPTLRTIRSEKKDFKTIYHRIRHIVNEVLFMIPKTDEAIICIERPFINPDHMNSQQDLLNLSYCIREKLYWAGLIWREVAPMTLKKFAFGSGKAKKSHMLRQVDRNWNIDAATDDEADAAALAYMARAMAVLHYGLDEGRWAQYQLEAARAVLTKGGS